MKNTDQSHWFTKKTVEHIDLIGRIAQAYEVSVKDILGRVRTGDVVDARRALCHALRKERGLLYYEIGIVINRDASSVGSMLKIDPKPPKAQRRHHPNPAMRDDVFRHFNKMLRIGSRDLAKAIFATGKLHGPMSEADQCAAVIWSQEKEPQKQKAKSDANAQS